MTSTVVPPMNTRLVALSVGAEGRQRWIVDGMDGMDGINGMDGMDGMDGIDGIADCRYVQL